MGHKNKESYNRMLAIGQSRHTAKANGTAKDKIFSWGTYHNLSNMPVILLRIVRKNTM